MNLFEIDKQIESCIDAETGEILDIEQLEALSMERSTKIENVACWIKNLDAEEKALAEQEKAFKERKEQAAAKKQSLKQYLAMALNGEKFSTDKCAVSFRKSKAVEIRDGNTCGILHGKGYTQRKQSYHCGKLEGRYSRGWLRAGGARQPNYQVRHSWVAKMLKNSEFVNVAANAGTLAG